MDSALPWNDQATPVGEQAALASTMIPNAPAPSDAGERFNVTARIGDVAYVTSLAQPTRGWRAVEAIFANDPQLTQIVVIRPSQIGGSYLIRRDERAAGVAAAAMRRGAGGSVRD
ncbi:hypothetical protein [Sphingomonas sp. BK580]|uniref:hypothetical protein n=1 Tax=Sphingomonas sp. BK580 TaxID=2586972 RepID=UPI0016115724|nr:hypothetical protein [Sphingomonas sp. BK580]MBB3695272.1 hypothetical protein [Sphingomonas sp. BK580]